MTIDSKSVKSEVETRLVQLHSLKAHRFDKFWKYRAEYAQNGLGEKTKDGYANYSMNTGYAIVNTKAADVMESVPKYDFVALDDEGRKYRKVKEIFWNYVWATSCTDKAIFKIVMDAMKYGVGWGLETVSKECRNVKVPIVKGDEIDFEERELVDYDGCKLVHIDWDRVYVNGSNIDETTEAVVVEYYDRDGFLELFGNDPTYSGVSDERIPKGKYYYVSEGSSELTVN